MSDKSAAEEIVVDVRTLTPERRLLVSRRDVVRSGLAALGAAALPAALPAAVPNRVLAAMSELRAKAARAARPVFVTGHYQQQLTERTALRPRVRGAVPPALSGRYIRNGHNPKPENIPPYWFDGNGMLHGVRLKDGRAEWYRNRYVQTPALRGAKLMRKDGSIDLTASAAATSIYAHAGRIYALQEVNLPYLIGPELQTLGVFDFGGKLKQPMTAHPKIDPRTGEMLFISYGPQEPHLSYFRVAPNGELTGAEVVPGAGPSIMHDFGITENYILFLDPTVVFDPKSKLPFPYTWDEGRQAQLGVMPRDRSKGPVRWFPVDPFFYFHISNAWEEPDGTLRMESTHYDRASWERFGRWLMSLPGHPSWLVQGDKFARWHVDPKAGTAKAEVRSDVSADFPTINQSRLGLRNRYTYAAAFPNGALTHNALVKYDGQTGAVALREFPAGQQPEEPWFVPDPAGAAEDDGWLLSYVSDLRTHTSALHILDASDFRARPAAVVEVPGWIPAGVHGSWIDDAVLAT